jgi:hypothetical protein
MHFPYLSRRGSSLEAVQLGGPSPQAFRSACAMTPHFLRHLSPVYTSLPQCWCTSMRILSTPILVVKLHRCAENRARFPNELLSLEQNKDAPFLTKEMIDWTFSESSGRTESHGVITDPPPPLFFVGLQRSLEHRPPRIQRFRPFWQVRMPNFHLRSSKSVASIRSGTMRSCTTAFCVRQGARHM